MKTRSAVHGGLLAALAFLAGAEPEKSTVYKTPGEVFAAARAAGKKGDYQAFYACLTPELQKEVLGGTILGNKYWFQVAETAKDPAEKAAAKQLVAVMKKYGVTEAAVKKLKPSRDEKDLAAAAALVKDGGAFYSAFLTALKQIGETPRAPYFDSELSDVKIEGDKAKGVLTARRRGTEQKGWVAFVKVGQGWKIAESLEPGQAPKAKPKPARKD